MLTVIRNAKVVLPSAVRDLVVAVGDGVIRGLHERLDVPEGAAVVDAGGAYITPGFVDIHVHGGGGHEIMSATPESVAGMCRAHLVHGTTSILPTLSAAPMAVTLHSIDAARAAIEGGLAPNAAGIHLEGPFLSPAQAGAQVPENLLVPADEDYETLLDRWSGIRMIGAAPELPGALDLGRAATRRGITASIAHSDADYAAVEAAAANGYTDVTHLYSGCSMMVRRGGFRVPGVVEAGLLLDGLTVQIIADLCHLPAELIRLIYKCKGPDRISLITDALPFAGTELTEGGHYFQVNGREVIYEDGVMKMPDRKAFCGSASTMDKLVRNLVGIGIPIVETIRMAATTPARVVGLRGKGRIAVGFDADLVLLDRDLRVRRVWLRGNEVAL